MQLTPVQVYYIDCLGYSDQDVSDDTDEDLIEELTNEQKLEFIQYSYI